VLGDLAQHGPEGEARLADTGPRGADMALAATRLLRNRHLLLLVIALMLLAG
jgi:hypothetical protein